MKKIQYLIFLLVILLLVGCSSATEVPPEATEAPAEAAPTVVVEETVNNEPVLTVAGSVFTMKDLESMEQVTVEADGASYTGVRILDVLEASGMKDVEVIQLVASDGYAADVVVADLDETCLLAFGENGALDSVLPGQSKGGWVRGTVEIRASDASASEEAEPEMTAEAVLTVGSLPLSMADIEALEQVTVKADGASYTGVRILDLLAAASLENAETIQLVASDGYAAEITVANLTGDCVLAFGEAGALDAVLPGQDKGGWVRGTIEISAAGEAAEIALTIAGHEFTMADIDAMEHVTVDADGASYTGVRILDLLEAAGVKNVESISLIASDGYAAEVAGADLDEQAVLCQCEQGGLDAVLPGQSKGSWVNGTVQIDAVVALPEGTIFTVNGTPFTMDDLQAMEQIEITVEENTYSGVRFLDVLGAAGVDSGTLSLLASDGYEGQAAVEEMTDQSILAFNDEGGVNAVLPEKDKGSWVKYIVKIETVEKPSVEALPTLQPIDSDKAVIVVDSLGNEVMIPAQVTAVASMRSGITEIIWALGQENKIVAVDEMVQGGFSYGEFIASVHPELMALPAPYAGQDISVEEMLRINPNLVLHGGYGRIKQAEALKNQAPNLPVVIAHFETIEAYMDDIRIVAQCVNADEARIEELIDYLQGMLDDVSTRVSGVPEAKKTRIFYSGHDVYHAYTPETFEGSQILMAGGKNVADQMEGWLPEVSPEQLLVWDPQVIVMLNGAGVEEVLNDSRIASLTAVKEGRVYALPEAGWDFSSPRALFAIEWLATKLYPDQFADIDIDEAADEFYQAVFGADYNGPKLGD